jgi:DNA-binding transcriptional MerR regulator
MEARMLSIGDLFRRTGVKVPTIRYYEQMGLMEAPERSEGNQRRYGRPERERLSFIKHARDLGLTIEAIRELIDLSAHPERPCEGADRIAAEQLAAVRVKIARLRQLEHELARIATCCTGDHVRECYVIRALADHALCEGEH